LLAGCTPDAPDSAPIIEPEAVSAAHCRPQRFEGALFTICPYDPARHRLALYLDGPAGNLRSLSALEAQLGPDADRLLFAINGGMYDEEGDPIGLYVADGRRRHALNRNRGPGNFHLLPNGVFQVDAAGRPSIVSSAAFDADEAPRWATQSGPMLVIDGALHPSVQPNGDSLHVRNGVGVTPGGIAWFAISEEPVSFGRLARLLRDGLGCRDALYLDGSVSSLWDRGAGRQDGYSNLGPLIAVFARSPEMNARPTVRD
jgi:uncharacterized protein YigE (DUF2233 family)